MACGELLGERQHPAAGKASHLQVGVSDGRGTRHHSEPLRHRRGHAAGSDHREARGARGGICRSAGDRPLVRGDWLCDQPQLREGELELRGDLHCRGQLFKPCHGLAGRLPDLQGFHDSPAGAGGNGEHPGCRHLRRIDAGACFKDLCREARLEGPSYTGRPRHAQHGLGADALPPKREPYARRHAPVVFGLLDRGSGASAAWPRSGPAEQPGV
mmetsp:Transcript_32238/g.76946  ORF Transcript_32238/g.76946 Transcript_32238/m.76946 type:complete len:214 (-) Transcript_32238:754-1395(-)